MYDYEDDNISDDDYLALLVDIHNLKSQWKDPSFAKEAIFLITKYMGDGYNLRSIDVGDDVDKYIEIMKKEELDLGTEFIEAIIQSKLNVGKYLLSKLKNLENLTEIMVYGHDILNMKDPIISTELILMLIDKIENKYSWNDEYTDYFVEIVIDPLLSDDRSYLPIKLILRLGDKLVGVKNNILTYVISKKSLSEVVDAFEQLGYQFSHEDYQSAINMVINSNDNDGRWYLTLYLLEEALLDLGIGADFSRLKKIGKYDQYQLVKSKYR